MEILKDNEFMALIIITFLIVLFVDRFADFFLEEVIHSSCRKARKEQKPICRCWDCKNPCKFWVYGKEKEDNERCD